MALDRNEYLKRHRETLDRLAKRISRIKADEQNDAGSAYHEKIIEIERLRIDAENAVRDLTLVSEPGFKNAELAAENTVHALEQAVGVLESEMPPSG